MEEIRPFGIDLFSGAGGMSLGFEKAGFNVATAVDCDPIHTATYAKNFPDSQALCVDISTLSGVELRSRSGLNERPLDVLFGGPPCNGFSLMGNRKLEDPRNQLLYHFARLVGELNPRYFVVENVTGLLVGPMVEMLNTFLRLVDEANYSVVTPLQVLDSSKFGVPQIRKRVFILGYKKGLPSPEYPAECNENTTDSSFRSVTVWEAIGDLPDVKDVQQLLTSDTYYGDLGEPESDYARVMRCDLRDTNDLSFERQRAQGLSGCLRTAHSYETTQRFGQTLPGAYEPVSRFYRLQKDGLAPTLRAGSDRMHGSFTAPRPIHPLHPRCITVREAARLHSFPDWFQFHPTKWHGFRQVGNSVPPNFAWAVARALKKVL